jgi:hypothetical protein
MFGGYTSQKRKGQAGGTMSKNLTDTSGADTDALVCSKPSDTLPSLEMLNN